MYIVENMEIISRDQALASGQRYFFTGKPCRRGHVSKRYTLNGGCDECIHPRFAVQPETPRIIDIRQSDPARMELERAKIDLQRKRLEIRESQQQFQRQNRTVIQERRQARRDALSRMLSIAVSFPPDKTEQFYDVAYACAIIRCPSLERQDVILKSKPRETNQRVRAFSGDTPALQEYARSLFSSSTIKPIILKNWPGQEIVKVEEDADWPKGDPR